MLRAALVLASIVGIAAGAVLIIEGLRGPGIYLLIVAAAVCLGTLFERWRYRQEEARPDAHWQRTGERFEDPHTGKPIEVFYDPGSGERRYVSGGAAQSASPRSKD